MALSNKLHDKSQLQLHALTVAHVLLECNHYNVVRQRYFNVSSLYELFDTVNAQNILGYIRDIGLYRLL